MKDPLIKIYGERHTGTRYLRELIRLNLAVRELTESLPESIWTLASIFRVQEIYLDVYFALTFSQNLGWKHTLAKPPKVLKNYSICSRNAGSSKTSG